MDAALIGEESLGVWLLAAARAVPIAWLVPVFGGPRAPALLRLAMGLTLSALAAPALQRPSVAGGAAFWALLVLRELAVGATLGFVVGCLFRAAEAAGATIDLLRGGGTVLSGGVAEGSPLGLLGLLLAALVFLQLHGPAHLAVALARSYEAVPVGVNVRPGQLAGVAGAALAATAGLISSAVAFAAPVLVAMLAADLLLGVMARFAPGLPVYFVGLPLKALGGVGVLLLALGGIEAGLVVSFRGIGVLVERTFALWR